MRVELYRKQLKERAHAELSRFKGQGKRELLLVYASYTCNVYIFLLLIVKLLQYIVYSLQGMVVYSTLTMHRTS